MTLPQSGRRTSASCSFAYSSSSMSCPTSRVNVGVTIISTYRTIRHWRIVSAPNFHINQRGRRTHTRRNVSSRFRAGGGDLDASQRMSAAGIFTRIPGTGSCRLTGNSQGVGCGHDKSAWSRIPACPRNAKFRRLFRLASYQQPGSSTSTHEAPI